MYGSWSDTTPFVVKYRNNSGALNSEVDSSIVINGSDIFEQRLRTSDNIYAFTSDNVASATKLQTARTLWGQSFDGTASVSGALTGVTNITASGAIITSSTLSKFGNIKIAAGSGNTIERDNGQLYIQYNTSNNLSLVNGGGNVGIGTASPSYKLDVSGTGRFTGNLTAPKVIFSAAGWSMVQVGTELQMQYNGVAKMRFLNGGSIVAVQEITAYG